MSMVRNRCVFNMADMDIIFTFIKLTTATRRSGSASGR